MIILVLDTETSGFDPKDQAVVEIAGVTIPGMDVFSSLVAPGKHIPPEASAIHHLRDIDVRDAPHLPLAINMMLQTLEVRAGEYVVAAHNAAFDMSFIGQFLSRQGTICTWKCAQHLYPDAPSYSNQTLRYYLGLDDMCRKALSAPEIHKDLVPHRALYDTIVTTVILLHMLEGKTPEELITLTNTPVLLKTVNFGKHRSLLWKDVPKDYLRWILREGTMNEDVLHTAKYWA